LTTASKRCSSDKITILWKEYMSRDSIGVMRGRLGCKSPIEWFTMSNIGSKSKEGKHTERGSFSFGVEHMGHDAT
jgi:hypothetical protein